MANNAPLAKMGVLFGLEDGSFQKGLKGVDKSLGRFAYKSKQYGKTMTRNVSVPLLGMGAAAAKGFKNFDAAMTNSVSIMGEVGPEMRRQMEDTALSIGRTTKIGATQAAESYFFLASAGLDVAQSLKALPAVAKFAQAGNFDMAEATDMATDAQSALGLTVKDSIKNQKNLVRVTDVLVKANTLANASTLQFSQSLTNKAGAALRNVNKEMEEGVAVLAAYADQGIKGEKGGEALNIVLRDLQKAAIQNKKAFKEHGVEVFNSAGEMNNMADIVGALEKSLGSMSAEQRKMALSQLGFQERSQSYLITLLGTSDAIRKYEQELKKAGGTTERVANKQMIGFSAAIDSAWNSLKTFGIQIGRIVAPYIEEFSKHVKLAADTFGLMDEGLQKTVIKIGLLVAAIGPGLLMLSQMATALRLLIAPSFLAKAALASLFVGVVVLGQYMVDNWGAIKNSLGRIAGETILNFQQMSYSVLEALQKVFDYFLKNRTTLDEYLGTNFTVNEDLLKSNEGALEGYLKGIEQSMKNTYAALGKLNEEDPGFGTIADAAASAMEKTKDALKTGLQNIISDTEIGNLIKQIEAKIAAAMRNPKPKPEESPAKGLNLFSKGQDVKIAKTPDLYPVKNFDLSKMRVELEETEKKWEGFSENLANNLVPVISTALGDAAGSFVELSTQAAISGKSFKSVVFTVLSSLADLAVRVGKIAIGVGLAVEGIKKALQSLNPVAAIAAGAALVALGTIAKRSLAKAAEKSGNQNQDQNSPTPFAKGGIVSGRVLAEVGEYPGARNNPEVISPLDKLQGMIRKSIDGVGMGSGTVVFEIEGTKLRGVLNNTGKNDRKKYGKVKLITS